MPKPADTVSVNYPAGTLIDGTEFDSSKPGQPATFQVTGVIPGWTEALEHTQNRLVRNGNCSFLHPLLTVNAGIYPRFLQAQP